MAQPHVFESRPAFYEQLVAKTKKHSHALQTVAKPKNASQLCVPPSVDCRQAGSVRKQQPPDQFSILESNSQVSDDFQNSNRFYTGQHHSQTFTRRFVSSFRLLYFKNKASPTNCCKLFEDRTEPCTEGTAPLPVNPNSTLFHCFAAPNHILMHKPFCCVDSTQSSSEQNKRK